MRFACSLQVWERFLTCILFSVLSKLSTDASLCRRRFGTIDNPMVLSAFVDAETLCVLYIIRNLLRYGFGGDVIWGCGAVELFAFVEANAL